MTDREALAAALEKWYWLAANGTTEMTLRYLAENDPQVGIELSEAARERLAQLPEQCGTCGGTGTVTHPGASEREYLEGLREDQCPHCRLGTVYPPALVERIAEAIGMVYPSDGEAIAVAVLGALNETL